MTGSADCRQSCVGLLFKRPKERNQVVSVTSIDNVTMLRVSKASKLMYLPKARFIVFNRGKGSEQQRFRKSSKSMVHIVAPP